MTAAGLDPASDASNLAVPSSPQELLFASVFFPHSVLSRSHRSLPVLFSVYPSFLPALPLLLSHSPSLASRFLSFSLFLHDLSLLWFTPAHLLIRFKSGLLAPLFPAASRISRSNRERRRQTLLSWTWIVARAAIEILAGLITHWCRSSSYECSGSVLIMSACASSRAWSRNSRCDRVLDRSTRSDGSPLWS